MESQRGAVRAIASERWSGPARRSSPASRRVNPAGARAALERAALTTNMLGTVAAHLATHPTALIDGDSAAPLAVARLIDALRAAGVQGLVDPCCMDCGQAKHLRYRVPGGRVCNACEKRRRPREPCARCGKLSPRGARVDGVMVGACCYVRPAERCTVCGVNRSGRSYRTRRRICTECAQRRTRAARRAGATRRSPSQARQRGARTARPASPAPCVVCGELTVAPDRQRRPRCEKCYRRPTRDVRTVRAGARDRPQGRRRRPGPVRDLLDRTDDRRASGAARSARAAGSGAAGCCAAAARRSGPQRCAHCGGTGVRWRTGPRARSAAPAITARCRRRAPARRAGRHAGCCATPGSPSPSAVTARVPTTITSAAVRCRGSAPASGGCARRCVLDDRLTELLGDRGPTRPSSA